MKNNKTLAAAALALSLALLACNQENAQWDASGSFEAEETIISAQTPGVLERFQIEAGQVLMQGEVLGLIDTLPLHLKKKQLRAQIEAVLSRKPNKAVQLASLREQLSAAEVDRRRIANLVEAKAMGQKQLDDISNNISVLQKQMRALKSNLDITSAGIDKETAPLQIQIEQIDDNIRRSLLTAPMNGTVLTRFARRYEMAGAGMPLYKLADLSSLILRAYVSNDQLTQIKLGQKVKVFTDDGQGGLAESSGTITWISDAAEFTPKTIQTKNERAGQVYAVKVKVPNHDGRYKIGMYGELSFQ